MDDEEGADPVVEDLEGPAEVDGVLEDGGGAEPGDDFFSEERLDWVVRMGWWVPQQWLSAAYLPVTRSGDSRKRMTPSRSLRSMTRFGKGVEAG